MPPTVANSRVEGRETDFFSTGEADKYRQTDFFGPRLYGLGGFGDAELAAFPVAAMPVAREGRGTIAFARDAGEVVEGEADGRFEYVLQVCFESAPVAGDGSLWLW